MIACCRLVLGSTKQGETPGAFPRGWVRGSAQRKKIGAVQGIHPIRCGATDKQSRGRSPYAIANHPFTDDVRSGLITACARGAKRTAQFFSLQASRPIIHPIPEIRQSPVSKSPQVPLTFGVLNSGGQEAASSLPGGMGGVPPPPMASLRSIRRQAEQKCKELLPSYLLGSQPALQSYRGLGS